MAEEQEPQDGAQRARGKSAIGMRELDEIYRRIRRLFFFSNILTMLLAVCIMLYLLFPKNFETTMFHRLQVIGLCVLLGSSILLSGAQWLGLRQTTQSSRRKIEELTFVDSLTNLYNYRYLDRRLDEELRFARRFHTTVSVVYMDLDNFKRVNDELGHQAGNALLAELGGFLKSAARSTDLAGRVGGDEFLLILPNTRREEAQSVSERIRRQLETRVFRVNEQCTNSLKASMGVASFPSDARDREGLVAAADQAMYRAKQSGGNCVRA